MIVAGATIDQKLALQPDARAAVAALGGVEPCDGSGPGLVRAVAAACELLHGRREVKSQVVVFTDLCATALAARNQEDLERIKAVQQALGDKLEIIFFNVGESRLGNQAIIDGRVRGRELRVGDDAHIIAKIANYSDQEVKLAPRLVIGGRKEPPSAKRTIPPGGEIIVDLTVRMNRSQRTFAEIQLQAKDALLHDNSFHLPLNVADSRRVLIINGAGPTPSKQGRALAGLGPGSADEEEEDTEETVDGARILRFALNPGRELGLTHGTGIVPTVITPEALAGQPLSKYDVVILYDVSSLTDAGLNDLDTYVRQGRALVIFTSAKLNPMRFNRTLASGSKKRAALSPAQIGNDIELKTPLGLADAATSHQVLSVFRERRRGDLSVVRFARLRELRGIGSDARVMFSDTSGRPLAIEQEIDQGRVVLFTFGLELNRGNLARTRVFLPMLWRLVDYLTGRLAKQPETAIPALRPMVLDVSEMQFAFVESLELNPAPGQDNFRDLPARVLPKGPSDTVLLGGLPAGRYLLHKPTPKNGTEMMISYARQIAVNADPRESDVRMAAPALLEELFGERVQVRTPADTAGLIPRVAELARWLVVLLILGYGLEALIGWLLSARRERERSAGVDG